MITFGSGYRHKFSYGMVIEIGISIQITYTGNLYIDGKYYGLRGHHGCTRGTR